MNAQSASNWKHISTLRPPLIGDYSAKNADIVHRIPRFEEVLETLDFFELVTVRGQVVDSLGLPIAGATVEIWHPTKWGMFGMEFGMSDAPVDANEQGWMQCTTNEKGEYSFLTEKRTDLMSGGPASLHVKVSTTANDLKITKLYFGQNHKEAVDAFLYDLEPEERSEYFGWESAGVCQFDIEV